MAEYHNEQQSAEPGEGLSPHHPHVRNRRSYGRLAALLAAAALCLSLMICGVLYLQLFFTNQLPWQQKKQLEDRENLVIPWADLEPAQPDPQPPVSPEPPAEPRFTVVLDPGHGGKNDPGTAMDDAVEKEIVLDVANLLKTRLEEKNCRVELTRTEDVPLKLGSRIKLANDLGADCFVSLHCNGYEGEEARGVECYYYKSDDGEEFAQTILDTADAAGLRTRYILEGNFQVLRQARVPAVLVEMGYVTNSEERRQLMSDDYREQLADMLCDGILAYLEK